MYRKKFARSCSIARNQCFWKRIENFSVTFSRTKSGVPCISTSIGIVRLFNYNSKCILDFFLKNKLFQRTKCPRTKCQSDKVCRTKRHETKHLRTKYFRAKCWHTKNKKINIFFVTIQSRPKLNRKAGEIWKCLSTHVDFELGLQGLTYSLHILVT